MRLNVGGVNSNPFVYFEVSGAAVGQNGFYVFPSTGINNLISSGNVVTIDYTNAVTSTGGSCPNDVTIPFFSTNLNTAYNLYAGVGQPCNDCGAAFSTPVSTTDIDISGYVFEIV